MNPRDRLRHQIIAALAEQWEKYPNFRFGQLVENLIKADVGKLDTQEKAEQHWEHCIFHTQDEDALQRILAGVGA